VAECPAEAIFAEDDLPDDQRRFIEINADLAKAWPVIVEKKPALADADAWNGKPGKAGMLEK
jgi:ferredoxin